jgi:hypothetical protein
VAVPSALICSHSWSGVYLRVMLGNLDEMNVWILDMVEKSCRNRVEKTERT